MTPTTKAPRAVDPATEYATYQPLMERRLRWSYRRLDAETRREICQDVWEELEKYRAKVGVPAIESVQGWLMHKLQQRATDRVRDRKHLIRGAAPADPLDELFAEIRDDHAADPERAAEVAFSAEQIDDILERLDAEEAGVLRLSVLEDRPVEEICERLGMNRKRYELVRPRALASVAAFLAERAGPEWHTSTKRLCERLASGDDAAAELVKTRQLAAHDPALRTALKQYADAVHGVATAVPADVSLRADGGGGLADRLAGLADRARDGVSSVFHRGGDTSVEHTTSELAASGAGRGAGAAGAGMLAKIAGPSLGAKIAVACLGGGAAATCVAAGIVPGVGLGGGGDAPGASQAVEERPDKVQPPPAPDQLPSQVGNEAPPPSDEAPAPEPAPVPEPAPAPAEPPQEEEFGIAGAAPTPAPSSGEFGVPSGGAAGGGGSAGGEFGGP